MMDSPESRALDRNGCAELLHLPVMDVDPRSAGSRLRKNNSLCGQVDRNRSSLCGERDRNVTKTSISAELAELQLPVTRETWRLSKIQRGLLQNCKSVSRFETDVEGKKTQFKYSINLKAVDLRLYY